ncbi:MAG: alpha-1,2-fucosyltransferase [Chitinophagaceae bacterium]|nr:MAG: alpha-1,2-fucosyltransferase [Chitinophagaceae bacterium]
MIITKLVGGLGNQMFQYAAGRYLAIKHGVKLKLDRNFFELYRGIKGVTQRNFELNVFNFPCEIASYEEIKKYKKKDRHYETIISNLLYFIGFPLQVYYAESGFSYNAIFNKLPAKTYIDGYWQSEKYFKNIENIIRKDFQFKEQFSLENERVATQIYETHSVGIHVRRSDYAFNKEVNQIHGTCSLSYYNKAIDIINSKVSNPYFFVFSDDVAWAEANLHVNQFPVQFINHNYGSSNYRDMQLMSLCKHNIIANSSFSWWGAWLNRNPGKIIIAPKKWFNDPSINTNDLIPENWIKL